MSRYEHGHRSTLHKAGIARRLDAERLFECERYGGAVYMAGYAVECALKAALMEVAGVEHLRELEDWLRSRAGLDPDQVLHNIEVLSEHHPGVKRMLANVNDPAARDLVRARNDCNRWRPSARYSSAVLDRESARRRLDAVDSYCNLIRNSR